MDSKLEKITTNPDWYEPYNISLGIRTGNLLFLSGQASVNENGELIGQGDFDAQVDQVFRNLSRLLENAGSSLDNVVKVTIFLTDMSNFKKIIEVRKTYFSPPYPADTIMEVNSLANSEWLIEIEAIAISPK